MKIGRGAWGLGLSQASFQLSSKEKEMIMGIFCIYDQADYFTKNFEAEAEGRLSKSFGIGQLYSASVTVCGQVSSNQGSTYFPSTC